jgi:anaerobic dimethyl sulfoxide reductase subunit B (iron-sulfur subunit)
LSTQYGFYFDESRCIQCRTCELACKSAHDIEPGVKWRNVIETWNGKYPDITRTFFSLSCMHCENPSCLTACPTGAISKRMDDGIVLVDSSRCNGCRECLPACPYGIPQFGKDGIMQMCDFCIRIGNEPACTVSCPAEALYSGNLDDLVEMAERKGKSIKRMDGNTGPSIVVVT